LVAASVILVDQGKSLGETLDERGRRLGEQLFDRRTVFVSTAKYIVAEDVTTRASPARVISRRRG
jgi:hypothetical protein